jgi:2-polyprenyl-6-methoxyphenol hydroxylase-like FAD-dependent oxidoreductase
MPHLERILIAGGGIGGLTLATALHAEGFAPELVERSPAWPATGAGITLHANAVRVLRSLGLGDAVDEAGAALRRWSFLDQGGEPRCATDLDDLWTGVGPCLGVTRVQLQQILLSGAAAVPRRLGVALTGLRQDDDRVSVTFSDGSSGDYDLVVGADGIGSTVRRLAVSPLTPSYAGTMAWRFVADARPPAVTDLMILMGEGCFFGLVPVGGGRTYGFAGVDSDRFEDPVPGRLERFRRRFEGFGGPVPAYLDALERDCQLHFSPVEWMELDSWHSGRVVLIGDAAHAAPPHMGEGGAMAMEDAVVLAGALRSEETVESALELYERRRRPRADWVQEQSRIAARAWILPPAVRNAALRERGDRMLRERYEPLIAVP